MNTDFYTAECISQAFIDRVGKVTYKQPTPNITTFYKAYEDYVTGNSDLMPHVYCRLTFPSLFHRSQAFTLFA